MDYTEIGTVGTYHVVLKGKAATYYMSLTVDEREEFSKKIIVELDEERINLEKVKPIEGLCHE